MRVTSFVLCAASFLIAGIVTADEHSEQSKPIELGAAQMDRITAGSLLLPNGKLVFADFDNPAPNVNGYLGALLGFCDVTTGFACHPALTRRSDTALVTGPLVPNVTGAGNDGPWTATIVSPVISCPDC